MFYLALVCLLSAFQCDDDYKPDEVVENLELVTVQDNKKEFSVGDYIFITSSISNEQITIDGKTINLRDYMSADETSLFFDLEISKVESNGLETSYFLTDAQEIEGTIFVQDQSPFFNIISPYNGTTATFSSKIGVKLTEPGTFALKTAIIKDRTYIISFDSQSALGTLQLNTNIANSDNDGIYRFTVE